jgi:PAS domain S-box-containing protein
MPDHNDMERQSEANSHVQGANENTMLFQLMVDSVKDYAIFALDAEGRVATWNSGAAFLKGYRADEILGKHFATFYPPAEVAEGKPQRELEIALRDGKYEEEGWRIRKDGSAFWANVVITPIRDAQGHLHGYAKVTRDLTERRWLSGSLDAFFELAHDLLCVAGFDGYFKRLGPAWQRTLGYSPEELMAVPTIEWVHPDDRDATLQARANLVNGDKVLSIENRYRCSDGSYRWLQWNATCFPEQNLVFGVARDVTDRKLSEEALRESEARLRSVVDANLLGIGFWDRAGGITDANAALLEIVGYSREEMLAGEVNWVDLTPSQYEYLDLRALQEIAETGICTPYEKEYLRRDGSRIPVLIRSAGLHGSSERGVFFALDVTERKQTEAHIQQQFDRLNTLHAIDQIITSSVDLTLTLSMFLDYTVKILNVDAAAILLLNSRTLMLEYGAGHGFRVGEIPRPPLRIGEGAPGKAAMDRRLLHIEDMRVSAETFVPAGPMPQERFVGYVAVPLQVKGQVVGVLELYSSTPLRPEPQWLDFAEVLAGQGAIAVDNGTMFINLQRSNAELSAAYDATIEGWSRALDLRDKETDGHSRRVAEMTLRLAQALGIDGEPLLHIRRGALLHDIGKMGIPDGVLLKPGPLTAEEWEIMKQHPRFAFELLSPIAFLRPALDIPYYHHEKWDGSGYPHQLRGEQIPLAARIFAVVDVCDALRSDRPYRKGWPEEQVRKHLQSLAGTHLDPKIVEVFLNLL